MDIPFTQTVTLRFSKNFMSAQDWILVPPDLASSLTLAFFLCSPQQMPNTLVIQTETPFHPTREAPLSLQRDQDYLTSSIWNISSLKLFKHTKLFSSLLTYCLLSNFSQNRPLSALEIMEVDYFFFDDCSQGCLKLLKYILCLADLWLVVPKSIQGM